MHRNHPNHLPPVKGNKQAKHAPLKDRKWASEGQAAAMQGEQQQQQAAGASGHVRARAGAAGSSRTGRRAGLAATATSWPRATRGQPGPRDLVPVRGKRRWSPLRPREPPALQSALSPGRLLDVRGPYRSQWQGLWGLSRRPASLIIRNLQK